MAAATKTPWRLVADEVVTCNCAWGCPCQFNALPTHGRCEAVVAMRIRDGQYGNVSLGGATFAGAYWWPGPIHLGNGICQAAFDDKTTKDQRDALLAMMSGKEGGTFFEIFASVVSTVLDPIVVPIRFEFNHDKRTATLNVPGFGEFKAEPLKNPITGEEHRARIELPNGFEYHVAEMGNCVSHKATLGDKKIANQNSYAQFAMVNWNNQ